MAHSSSSKIEDAISILSGMEKELDEVMMRVSEMKRVIINLAREEAEKTKGEFVAEASRITQESLDQVKAEAEREAEKILSDGEEELKALKARMDQAFDKAVLLVVKAVLGE